MHTQAETRQRPYRSDDYLRVRELLLDTYDRVPQWWNWEIRRWDGQRWHRGSPEWDAEHAKRVRLWETADGRLVGAVHPEGERDAWLELDPRFRYLEDEMVGWAEENLGGPSREGDARVLFFAVYEYDVARQRLLEGRGFERSEFWAVTRRLRLRDHSVPRADIALGYTLRTTRPGDRADCRRVAELLNAAFGRDFHTEDEVHTFTTRSPSFRHDLDLVAEAADGTFASYVSVTVDDLGRYGVFEPVCTHPDHQRAGLARALIHDGLRRLRDLGVPDAFVDTGMQAPANQLYEACGFTEVYRATYWRKAWPLAESSS